MGSKVAGLSLSLPYDSCRLIAVLVSTGKAWAHEQHPVQIPYPLECLQFLVCNVQMRPLVLDSLGCSEYHVSKCSFMSAIN